MKIEVWQIGKKKDKQFEPIESEYIKRLKGVHQISFRFFKEAQHKNMSSLQIKKQESEAMISQFSNTDFKILLDEHGSQLTSLKFSKLLSETEVKPNIQKIIFCIGGAYGFSDEIRQKTNFQLSLSKMTFAHKMVPALLMEQIYRAHTIKIGHQYHKE